MCITWTGNIIYFFLVLIAEEENQVSKAEEETVMFLMKMEGNKVWQEHRIRMKLVVG